VHYYGIMRSWIFSLNVLKNDRMRDIPVGCAERGLFLLSTGISYVENSLSGLAALDTNTGDAQNWRFDLPGSYGNFVDPSTPARDPSGDYFYLITDGGYVFKFDLYFNETWSSPSLVEAETVEVGTVSPIDFLFWPVVTKFAGKDALFICGYSFVG